MKNNMVRFLMFAAAVLLTVLLPLIWEIVVHGWIAVAFLVLAECLVFLVPAMWKEKNFPLRLPLMLFVYPVYFVLTLALVLTAGFISLRLLLTIELAAAFLVLVSICICELTKKNEEQK